MILTETTRKLIKSDMMLRYKLAIELNCSDASLRRWIRENKENNDLTKDVAVQYLIKYTKLSKKELYQ